MSQSFIVQGKVATLHAGVNGYRVTVTVEPIADKPLNQDTATFALNQAMPQFPQKHTSAPW